MEKFRAAAVKPDQIKTGGIELPVQNVSGAEERAVQYKLDHVTIRQAIDIAYELEHTDPSLRLEGIEFTSSQVDPHYYEVDFKNRELRSENGGASRVSDRTKRAKRSRQDNDKGVTTKAAPTNDENFQSYFQYFPVS